MDNDFKNKIFILDMVLSPNDCESLIDYYRSHGATHEWNGTRPMTMNLIDQFLKSKVSSILDRINLCLDGTLAIDWCEIVEWPEGSRQNLHYDDANNNTVFTSITYLNDDYLGGRTYIKDDIETVPKIGRTVCFDGNHYLHGVTEVTQGTRYTLPIWYKKQQCQKI